MLMAMTGCSGGGGTHHGGEDGGTEPEVDAGADAGAGGTDGGCAEGQLFERCHPWTTDVSRLTKHSESDAIINALSGADGWGSGNFRTDRSLVVLNGPAGMPFRAFTPISDFYSPDCDNVPMPVPTTGAIEGDPGFACTSDGDCHLLVVDVPGKRLYEMWRAHITGTSTAQFRGGCAAVWDLTRAYGSTPRGRGCSSADGAGFPIAAMLANADEVYSGEVRHALRFTLPNERIRDGI
ncbi:hypothetical protein [Hyalangium sp.]|uniref:hypothetical protein n=1 Tax=Hyalangium sp. TaxID=2028555 RepID=UPI002D30CA04|nr:hypothetical protein [Hyalangium sp.]HYH99661.1 hypothetical protein [Hyalangium sp.]